MPRLLVIDDDPTIHQRFRLDFADSEVEPRFAATAAEGLQLVRDDQPDVIVLDVMLPDLSGLETFQRVHELAPKTPVIFITAHAESSNAIEAMKLGALDYLIKPLHRAEVRELVRRALEIRRLMETPVLLPAGQPPPAARDRGDRLVGRCLEMQEVYKAIGRVASQDVTVLVLGESGTGKELVARAIYQHGKRARGPFLAINCAAIPEALLESELFGHEKGAFTGAEQRRIGKFEQCSGGTIFLDEIGDMPPTLQSKMLRLLQEQRFERVGGGETIRTDVRIIAATNRDLEQAARGGAFRGDLFYRLNVFTIHLPPLRKRMDDLPLLIDHFLTRFSHELGREVHGMTPEAQALLARYPWPGNIRELQSVLKQAILNTTGQVLLAHSLPRAIREHGIKPAPPPSGAGDALPEAWQSHFRERMQAGGGELYAEALALLERQLFGMVLRHTKGNQLQAAKILGITRGTLRAKLRALGIEVARGAVGDAP